METRQQVGHLLRRFGLGAGTVELDEYTPLGVDGAMDRLLNYEQVDEQFPISPWQFCFEPNNKEVYLDPGRIVAWWSLRLLMTRRPLQEKLTVFWHNHFAVSAQKVEFGPMMLGYLDALRTNALGPFPALLRATSKDPAMIRWLDTDQNFKGRPNENFAREGMELFTLGIGNYTEKDVQELARCFTGWGNRYLMYEPGAEKLQDTAKDFIQKGLPMVTFCESPDLHDSGLKTVLGQTADFDGDQALDLLARRPETGRHLATKMWEFFAYPKPEAAVVKRLAAVYFDSGMSTKAMLKAISQSPEFWSEKCVRAQVKSPLDFTCSIARQFGIAPVLLSLQPKEATPTTPLRKELRDSSGLILGPMYQQGMTLLFPPDVGGWKMGNAWISTNAMLDRIRMGDLVFGVGQPDQFLAGWLAGRVVKEFKPSGPGDIVSAVLSVFDASIPDEKRQLLVKACADGGGLPALGDPKSASKMFSAVCRLLFGAPEFQFC